MSGVIVGMGHNAREVMLTLLASTPPPPAVVVVDPQGDSGVREAQVLEMVRQYEAGMIIHPGTATSDMNFQSRQDLRRTGNQRIAFYKSIPPKKRKR